MIYKNPSSSRDGDGYNWSYLHPYNVADVANTYSAAPSGSDRVNLENLADSGICPVCGQNPCRCGICPVCGQSPCQCGYCPAFGQMGCCKTCQALSCGCENPENGFIQGSLIPFSSGYPVTLHPSADIATLSVATIGFGISRMAELNDLVNTGEYFGADAFVAPEDLTIYGLAASFRAIAAQPQTLSQNLTVYAQLYASISPTDSRFAPVAETEIALSPVFTGTVAQGTIATGSVSRINVAVSAGTRLLLVYYTEGAETAVPDSIQGEAAAGLTII